jgi:hypothetical protein
MAGLGIGAWIVWKLLANPERAGAVAIWLTVQLLVLAVGTSIALQPTIVKPDDYPGRKAELHVEVMFPLNQIREIEGREQLYFEMRSADGEERASIFLDQVRRESDGAVVPGVFRIRTTPRSKLLAVMKHEKQLMCSTLNVERESFDSTTQWSEWQEMEEGFRARWRFVLSGK